MPKKWTPANRQMLFWIALQGVKIDPKKIVNNWPIESEDQPTVRAITEQLLTIRKGIAQHGVANFFHGTITRAPVKTPVKRNEHESSRGLVAPGFMNADDEAKFNAIKTEQDANVDVDVNVIASQSISDINHNRKAQHHLPAHPHSMIKHTNHQPSQAARQTSLPTPPRHTPPYSSFSSCFTEPQTQPQSRKRARTPSTDNDNDCDAAFDMRAEPELLRERRALEMERGRKRARRAV